MNNYELNHHKKSDTIKWIIAFTLIFALMLGMGAVLFGGIGNKADDPKETETEIEDVTKASPLIANTMSSSGMRLLSTSEPMAASTSNTVTIRATLTASAASYNDDVRWALTFKNATSSWASGKNPADYVTMTVSSDTKSIEVTAEQAFGEPIIVTAISVDNEECSATCQLDYVKRVTKITSVTFNSGTYQNYVRFGTSNSVTANVEYGTGTLSPEISITSLDMPMASGLQSLVSSNITTGSMQARTSINALVSGSARTGSYATGTFSLNVTDLFNGGGDSRALNNAIYNNAHVAPGTSGASYMSCVPIVNLSVEYNDIEYQAMTYPCGVTVKFERGSLALATTVSSVTLDKGNIAF